MTIAQPKNLILAQLVVPTQSTHHINNLKRVKLVIDKYSKSSELLFYWKSESMDVLREYLLIEHIAHYYGEVLSNNVDTFVAFVLPFPSDQVKLDYIADFTATNKSKQVIHVYFDNETELEVLSDIAIADHLTTDNACDDLVNIWTEHYPFRGQTEEQKGIYAKYKVTCLGGTFDRLHIGHQLMLTCLVMILDTVDPEAFIEIGLSGSPLLQKKEYKELIEPWDLRKRNVERMLKLVHPGVFSHKNQGMIHIAELFDPFGPSTQVAEIEALVISEETRRGGEAVNRVRLEKGLVATDMVCIPVVHSRDGLEKLSSTQKRKRDHDACELRRQ